VADWRARWDAPELPFIWVQLPNFMEARPEPSEGGWARLREWQRRALEIPHTGMAVTIDVGEWNDIHPLNKKTVGERLALEARRVAYGEEGVPGSPVPLDARLEEGMVHISFTNVDAGLVACGGELRHFALAGKDGRFAWAQARIEGDEVVVWSDHVPDPVRVRYAWADNPEGANLYNAAGLPASPFEMDVGQD